MFECYQKEMRNNGKRKDLHDEGERCRNLSSGRSMIHQDP